MTILFQRPIRELIRVRKSTRTYTGAVIDPSMIDQLTDACALLDQGFMGEAARFMIVEKQFLRGARVKLGNYGLQKNPRYFFIGVVKKSEMTNESYGYLMEKLVLKATDLGLGSCWIGFFNRKVFHDFQVGNDERFPATCTVGHAADRRIFEKISRAVIRADQRKSSDKLFFEGDFETPLSLYNGTPYSEMLEMVRLAPSSGNSQPWRIVKDKKHATYHFFMKKVRNIYFQAGLHHIDLGIAMCHFDLTARELGISGVWQRRQPDMEHIPSDTIYTMSWVES